MAEMTYQQCPFCAWCRPIKYGGREVRFDKVDPENVKAIQVRELTGQRFGTPKGGHIEIIESQTLRELPEDLKEQIRRQCDKILKALS